MAKVTKRISREHEDLEGLQQDELEVFASRQTVNTVFSLFTQKYIKTRQK